MSATTPPGIRPLSASPLLRSSPRERQRAAAARQPQAEQRLQAEAHSATSDGHKIDSPLVAMQRQREHAMQLLLAARKHEVEVRMTHRTPISRASGPISGSPLHWSNSPPDTRQRPRRHPAQHHHPPGASKSASWFRSPSPKIGLPVRRFSPQHPGPGEYHLPSAFNYDN